MVSEIPKIWTFSLKRWVPHLKLPLHPKRKGFGDICDSWAHKIFFEQQWMLYTATRKKKSKLPFQSKPWIFFVGFLPEDFSGPAFRLQFSDGHVGHFPVPRPQRSMWSQELQHQKKRVTWGAASNIQEETWEKNHGIHGSFGNLLNFFDDFGDFPDFEKLEITPVFVFRMSRSFPVTLLEPIEGADLWFFALQMAGFAVRLHQIFYCQEVDRSHAHAWGGDGFRPSADGFRGERRK